MKVFASVLLVVFILCLILLSVLGVFDRSKKSSDPATISSHVLKWGFRVFTSILLTVVFAAATVRMMNYFPAPVEDVKVQCDGKQKKELKPGDKLKILVWNIQYSASRKYHFFYDRKSGGTVHAEKDVVEQTMKKISAVIKEVQPDIVLWQEVDRGADRTHRIDQLKQYWKDNEMQCWVSSPYHKSLYIPSPSHQHMGRVHMDLATFSKFKVKKSTRFALPALKKDPVTNAFHLKRAILEVEIPIKGGKSLFVLNTHFSAFSRGDGTMAKQVKKVIELTGKHEKNGNLWVIAGDFNLLPPGVDPKKLSHESDLYAPLGKNPIKALFSQLNPVLSLEEYKKNPDAYNTYLSYGTKKTDRWIDHSFASKKLKTSNYKVYQKYNHISDHLPIVFEVEVPK